MALAKSYLPQNPYRFHSNDREEAIFEFEEADLWNSNGISSTELKNSIPPTFRFPKKSIKKMDHLSGGTAKSLPVNIPDWSKIKYRDGDSDDDDDDDDDDDEKHKVPPHEYLLARQMRRTQIACSFSVHEGRGRTLKGRDLSRVRNTIWEKMGFQD